MIASESVSNALTILLFGPMHVLVDGHPLPHLRSRKAQWMLALLALRAGRPVEREWLAGTLWPDADQRRAAANLRVVLSELRHALGSQGERLKSPSRHTLSLDLVGADVDLCTFDAAVTSQEPMALKRAILLYKGPLLEGCAEEWVGQDRIAREQNCLQALQTLADAALAAKDRATAADYYRQAVSIDPWQEAAQRGLMQALSGAGDINAALDIYQSFVRLLRKDDPKAVPDEKTIRLYTRLRAEVRKRASVPAKISAKEAALPAVTGYLPHPLTDLVGRDDEREEVGAKLRRSRLVTLTGPGGIGKTRLAIEVATDAAPSYADGVWLVGLDALSDGGQVPARIAGVFGVNEEAGRTLPEGLIDHLRHKRLLLVLDNCEHLVEASAHIAGSLLRECPGVRILATSREPLGIMGETAWEVPALSVPDIKHLPTHRTTLMRVLAGYESVQLFVERAQAIDKTFGLTGNVALPLARVCVRLQGVPLAIELAAAWVRVLTVEQIALRLDDYLGFLAGKDRSRLPRQQTLRATLDWSYDLLDTSEQLLLCRLSIFAGGWDLEAAEHVCAGGIEEYSVLKLLSSLVDKSLVNFKQGEEEIGGRYRLLETVRQYAAERLDASGEADRIRSRHRDWFAALAARASPGLRGADQVSWLHRLEKERENHRAALTWSGSDAIGVETGLEMASQLWWFWYIRGHLSEGKQLLEYVLQRDEAQKPTAARGGALVGVGTLSAVIGDQAAARRFYEEGLTVYRLVGKPDNIASTLGNLGNVALFQGEYDLARERFTESLEISRTIGASQRTAASLGNLACVALIQDDYASAWMMNQEALEIFRALQDRQGSAWTLNSLGEVSYYYQGDMAASQRFYEEALALFQELQEKRGICDALSGLGDLEMRRRNDDNAHALYRESLIMRRDTGLQGGVEYSLREFASLVRRREPGKSVCLWSAAEALRKTLGSKLLPASQRLLKRDMEETRTALGEDAFAAAWAEGHVLTWEQAVAYALEEH